MLRANSVQPRDYQLTMAESALKANTLVVLPTGLGKTLVAILVAKGRLDRFPDGKVLVMAPTRPLVLQHRETFAQSFALPEDHFALLTGGSAPALRSELWERSRFIFATPQTVRNDARKGRALLEDFVLAVFDEAHRSVKDYSYTEVAKTYNERAHHPLILGLTASPGGSREKVLEIERNLFIANVEARTEVDDDVKQYVEETELEGVRVTLPKEYGEVLRALRSVYDEKVKRLIDAGYIKPDRITKKALLDARTAMTYRLKAAEESGADRGYIFGAIINQAQAVLVLHAIELLETQGMDVLKKYLLRQRESPTQSRSAAALMKDPRWTQIEKEVGRLADVEHPKFTKLASILKEQFSEKPDSKAIVFTQYRDTIDLIVTKLNALGIEAQRFVGQANKLDNEGMDQKKQHEVLEMFKRGEFGVLVSSSIGEEGLHVPDVDLVVFYEAVPSEIRSIQRRGRTGRTAPGRVMILLAEGTVDEAYYYSSLSKEKRMKRLVSGASVEARAPKSHNPTLLDFLGGSP